MPNNGCECVIRNGNCDYSATYITACEKVLCEECIRLQTAHALSYKINPNHEIYRHKTYRACCGCSDWHKVGHTRLISQQSEVIV